MKTTHLRKQSGSSLVVVLSVLATLMVVVAVAAEYTSTINRHVQRSNTEQSALAVADSCIEILFANWRAICSRAGSVTSPQTTNDLNGTNLPPIPLPTSQQLGLPNNATFKRGTSINPNNDEYDVNFTVSNYKVVATNAQWNSLGSASAIPEPMFGQIVDPVTSLDPLVNKKIKTTPLVWNYMASADVTLPALGTAGNRTITARVKRVFQKQQLSPWNFAIFYVDPLEIHPGPLFTVTGWVHTNSDLFTGKDTLTFADKVTYGADWFVGWKPGETYHPPAVPTEPHYPSNLHPARDQALQPFGLDSTSIFSTSDTNPNNDSYHELIEQATAGFPDPLSGQRYYDQAAIKILIDGSNVLTIKKLDGTTVTASSIGYDKKLHNAITAAMSTGAQIYDNRESQATKVRLATLDMSSIVTSLNNSSLATNYIDSNYWNGIIYIADTSATSSTRRGIRLKNGKVLPNNGVTIASNNAVYIQGDYNTGNGTVPSNATSNNNPLLPTSTGYVLKDHPSAVVADAVNILSNSWDDNDAQTTGFTARIATNTTVNTAIVAGIVPSSPVGGDGSYSGGAENFPRFLEDWSSIKFTYYGSMVELYNSRQAIGKWTMTNVYDAPDRQWYFDQSFKTNPPPGSLMLYSYVKGKWTAY
jgi:hypothetical protein